MDRNDILSRYTVVSSVDQLVDAYTPLVTDIGAEYISVQIASLDPMATIERVGTDVLPALRDLAPATAT